jgi:hypothetical protein
LAVIFLILGAAFVLYFLIRLPRLIRLASGAFSGETYDLGYFTGTVIYFMIHLTITFFLFRFAIRWLGVSPGKINGEVLDGHLKNDTNV